MPPGTPTISGHDTFRGYWQAAIDGGLSEVVDSPTAAQASGDIAVTMGPLSASMGGQELIGKYI